ncbi:hypothetical protein RDABS01_007654 [Bienertia sinuspersici]
MAKRSYSHRPSAQIWRASGITSELQLYCTAIGALVFAALMLLRVVPLSQSCSKIGLVPRCRIYVESPFSRLLDLGLFLAGIKSMYLYRLTNF